MTHIYLEKLPTVTEANGIWRINLSPLQNDPRNPSLGIDVKRVEWEKLWMVDEVRPQDYAYRHLSKFFIQTNNEYEAKLFLLYIDTFRQAVEITPDGACKPGGGWHPPYLSENGSHAKMLESLILQAADSFNSGSMPSLPMHHFMAYSIWLRLVVNNSYACGMAQMRKAESFHNVSLYHNSPEDMKDYFTLLRATNLIFSRALHIQLAKRKK